MCNKLEKYFYLSKLKKIPLKNNLERQINFTCFNNYINPYRIASFKLNHTKENFIFLFQKNYIY